MVNHPTQEYLCDVNTPFSFLFLPGTNDFVLSEEYSGSESSLHPKIGLFV